MSNLPKISIVITSYMESSKRYLDLCVKSIRNLEYPKELLDIILVTKPSYRPEYEGIRTVWPDLEPFANCVGLNYGIKQASPDSTHFFVINDDVILTKKSLINLVESLAGNNALVIPTTQCDNCYHYLLSFGFWHEGKPINIHDIQGLDAAHRFYRYEHWVPYLDSMMNSYSLYPRGLVTKEELCLFAFLVPRTTWEQVGGFNEGFETSADDIDWSRRARKQKVALCIALDSLVWHFGGATSSESMTPELRQASKDHFKAIWGEEPPT